MINPDIYPDKPPIVGEILTQGNPYGNFIFPDMPKNNQEDQNNKDEAPDEVKDLVGKFLENLTGNGNQITPEDILRIQNTLKEFAPEIFGDIADYIGVKVVFNGQEVHCGNSKNTNVANSIFYTGGCLVNSPILGDQIMSMLEDESWTNFLVNYYSDSDFSNSSPGQLIMDIINNTQDYKFNVVPGESGPNLSIVNLHNYGEVVFDLNKMRQEGMVLALSNEATEHFPMKIEVYTGEISYYFRVELKDGEPVISQVSASESIVEDIMRFAFMTDIHDCRINTIPKRGSYAPSDVAQPVVISQDQLQIILNHFVTSNLHERIPDEYAISLSFELTAENGDVTTLNLGASSQEGVYVVGNFSLSENYTIRYLGYSVVLKTRETQGTTTMSEQIEGVVERFGLEQVTFTKDPDGNLTGVIFHLAGGYLIHYSTRPSDPDAEDSIRIWDLHDGSDIQPQNDGTRKLGLKLSEKNNTLKLESHQLFTKNGTPLPPGDYTLVGPTQIKHKKGTVYNIDPYISNVLRFMHEF